MPFSKGHFSKAPFFKRLLVKLFGKAASRKWLSRRTSCSAGHPRKTQIPGHSAPCMNNGMVVFFQSFSKVMGWPISFSSLTFSKAFQKFCKQSFPRPQSFWNKAQEDRSIFFLHCIFFSKTINLDLVACWQEDVLAEVIGDLPEGISRVGSPTSCSGHCHQVMVLCAAK